MAWIVTMKMDKRRHLFLIVSMLLLRTCSSFGKRRSWLGPANFLQFQDLPTSRDSFGFTSAGGEVYLFGGIGNERGMHSENRNCDGCVRYDSLIWLFAENDLHRFEPETNAWIDLSQMTTGLDPPKICSHRIVSLGQSIYSFGGTSDQGSH